MQVGQSIRYYYLSNKSFSSLTYLGMFFPDNYSRLILSYFYLTLRLYEYCSFMPANLLDFSKILFNILFIIFNIRFYFSISFVYCYLFSCPCSYSSFGYFSYFYRCSHSYSRSSHQHYLNLYYKATNIP